MQTLSTSPLEIVKLPAVLVNTGLVKYRMVYPRPGILCSTPEERGEPDILMKHTDTSFSNVSMGTSGTRGVCQ